MPKTFKDIKKELQLKEPELYEEIMTEATQEIEEIKKQWGGKRPNAGRKKENSEKVKETFDLEKTDIISLKEYAKKHKISKNKALHEAINNLIRKNEI